MLPISTITIPDADVDLEELELLHEYRVMVVTAAKYKAKIHTQLMELERRKLFLEKRLVDADSMLTRATAG